VVETPGLYNATLLSAGGLIINPEGAKSVAEGDFTISGIFNPTYDGRHKSVSVANKPDKSQGAITLRYGVGHEIPVDAGAYSVYVFVAPDEVNGYGAGYFEIGQKLVINPRTVQTGDFVITLNNTIYDGADKIVLSRVWKVPFIGDGALSFVKEDSGTVSDFPKDAGTYTIKMNLTDEDPNWVTDSFDSIGTLTIVPGTLDRNSFIYDNASLRQPYNGFAKVPKIMLKDGTPSGTPLNPDVFEVRYILSAGSGSDDNAPSQVGIYPIRIGIKGVLDGNWSLPSGSTEIVTGRNLTIVKGIIKQAYVDVPPRSAVPYNGESKAITTLVNLSIEAEEDGGAPHTETVVASEIIYKRGGVVSDPVVAGTYELEVVFDSSANPNWEANSERITYGTLVINKGTLIRDMFDLGGLNTSPTLVEYSRDPAALPTIKWKDGTDTGIVTKYNNQLTISPLNVGRYTVTFIVEGDDNWNNVEEPLFAGILEITRGTPDETGYRVSNGNITLSAGSTSYFDQTLPSTRLLSIAPVANIGMGPVTAVFYNGREYVLPTSPGVYPITFNVGMSTNYKAQTGLFAGYLIILSASQSRPQMSELSFTWDGSQIVSSDGKDLSKVLNLTFGDSYVFTLAPGYEVIKWANNGWDVMESGEVSKNSTYFFNGTIEGMNTVSLLAKKDGKLYSAFIRINVGPRG